MKPIPNFSDYSITEDGKVYSFKKNSKGKELKKEITRCGHYKVNLCKDGKVSTKYVHKLVAECYIPNPYNCTLVKHKNGDTLDNRKDNLEWRESYSSMPEYTVWVNMLARCNPKRKDKHSRFSRYSGRGISVCERWKLFENFYQDMGKRPGDNYDLDRINNDGNYCPDNCRWATRQDNINNRTNSRKIVIDGEEKTLMEIAIEYGINYRTVTYRYEQGLRGKDIIKPPRNYSKRRQNRG